MIQTCVSFARHYRLAFAYVGVAAVVGGVVQTVQVFRA